MAKTNVNIGSAANDGTGDPLRTAFTSINSNTDEIYSLFGNGSTLAISGDATVSAGALTIANDAVEGTMLNTNSADGTTIELSSDSLSVLKVPNDLTVDDSTIALNSGTTFNGAGARTVSVKDNGITHDKLEPRYTEEVSITTLTGTVSFNCASGSVFKLSGDLTGTYTISLTGYKKGQVITIYPLKGNQTLNLAGAGSSTNTFNKIGGVDYEDDGTSSNILQIECVDDSATDPIFFYTIATFAADSSDI